MNVELEALQLRATEAFGRFVHSVGPSQWRAPTPNPGWDVRALVQHLVAENRSVCSLLARHDVEDRATEFDGDALGADLVGAWDESAARCVRAVHSCDLDAPVRVANDVVPAEERVGELFADLVVHSWDLAVAIGAGTTLDAELVDRCAAWFPLRERAYREAGSIGPRVPRSDDADAQSRLLAAFGRDDSPRSTFAVVTRFNSAFAGRAVDEIMSTMTDDCVFEDTAPPDGHRYDGQAAVRAAWETLFRTSPDAKFETEEGFVAGNRAVYRWCYRFDDGHVRSVDVFTTRDGLVAAKRSYVKG